MANYCKTCGAQLENDIEYCEKCGTKIEKKGFPMPLLLVIIAAAVVIAFMFLVNIATDGSGGNDNGDPADGPDINIEEPADDGFGDNEPAVDDMVEILMPRIYIEEMSDEDIQFDAQLSGYEAFLNSDGSVTYRMTKEQQQECLDATKYSIDWWIQGMFESGQFPGLVDVQCNEDYSEIKILYTSDFKNKPDSYNLLNLLYLGVMAPQYQVYQGKGYDAKCYLTVVDDVSGEVYLEFTGPDDLSKYE